MAEESVTIRVGKVSSINYTYGFCRVVYEDKDEAVTKEIPFSSLEYNMPQVGDQVYVIHLSNGAEFAICLDAFWTKKNNVPPEGFEHIYRKDLWRKIVGLVVTRYNAITHIRDEWAPHIRREAKEDWIRDIAKNIYVTASQSWRGSAPTVYITGDVGDVIINGVSLVNHTHSTPDGETSPPIQGG